VARSYRLAWLAVVVTAVLLASVAFFVAWALAPVVLIGLFYVGFVLNEHRGAVTGAAARARLRERRQRLALEAAARRAELHREEP
jgi:fatty acid desaturase